MSKKSFKIARKPGQGDDTKAAVAIFPEPKRRSRSPTLVAIAPASVGVGLTTRKTIEVPEDFFRRVKIRAVEQGMLQKERWSEILGEYFKNHPTA